MTRFTQLSEHINKLLPKCDRQKQGIFFTPRGVRERVHEILGELELDPSSILEPSCGTGEFLNDLNQLYPEADLFGVEFNETIFDQMVESIEYPANLFCMDFLEYQGDPVDLIIGNPPYFVTKIKNKECMSGRGNIFVLFIYKCLTRHLVKGGVLAFVLPTSFYNCLYYHKCREYIARECTILHVESIDADFYDTNQNTMILVIRNQKSERDDYIFRSEEAVYITPFYNELRALTTKASTLKKLGYQVKTGTVVWNQHKDALRDEDGVLLIYSSNIGENHQIIYPELGGQKKQYLVCDKRAESGPSILITRGYGNSYRFRYAMVNIPKYYAENHLNVVTRVSGVVDISVILASLERKETADFIRYFVGNGALSKTELETVLPIFS